VHILRIFYTLVCTSFKLGHINERQASELTFAGLSQASKTTCKISKDLFNRVLEKAYRSKVVSSFKMLELDKEAGLYHSHSQRCLGDIWSHINCFTTSSLRKGENFQNVLNGVNELIEKCKVVKKGLLLCLSNLL